jgi:hypothetical protein
MKNRLFMWGRPSGSSYKKTEGWHTAMWHRLQDSDRAFFLTCLAIPLVMALVAFVIAVALTGFSAPTVGTLRSTVAGFAYVYLMLCLMWVPGYLISGAWYWWVTRDDESIALDRLYTTPLIGALFIWFPTLLVAPATSAQKLQMFPMLALGALVAGYLWIGIVRLMFYVWRR